MNQGSRKSCAAAVADGTLNFTTDTAEAVKAADAVFIAVGTPSRESGAYDFQYVEAARREIGQALGEHKRYLVVLKSTVTPDIYARVHAILTKETAGSGAEFEVVSNPEFLAEGTAIRDFAQPHRVIVGVVSQEAQEFMEALYSPFTKRKAGLLQFTDPKSAIVTKLAANSFLACRVALINELARYCDAVGADIESVRTGLASDPRIGQLFLYAGPGYGGSCFGKDIRALRESAREHGTDVSLIPAIEESNNRHKFHLPKKIEQLLRLGGGEDNRSLGPGVQGPDRRYAGIAGSGRDRVSASARGAYPGARSPGFAAGRQELFWQSRLNSSKTNTLRCAARNALVIMTEWDAYKSPDYHELRERLTDRVIFDGRNILEANEVRQAGLIYIGMGRPPAGGGVT